MKKLPLYRSLCFVIVALLSKTVASQELAMSGIGLYQEFNSANMVVQIEALDNSNTESVTENTVVDRLSIRIIEPRSERSWSQFWRHNLALNNSDSSATTYIGDLTDMLGVVKQTLAPGDLIEFEVQRDKRVAMRMNSLQLAQFSDTGFYDFLLTALLGEIPASQTLKRQLLGENQEDDQRNISLFNNLVDRFAQE